MFSIAGDTVLDPFSGTASKNLAALAAGRNSIGNEVELTNLEIAYRRLTNATKQDRLVGARSATPCLDPGETPSARKAISRVISAAGSLSGTV
jgi:DNA modification methylase